MVKLGAAWGSLGLPSGLTPALPGELHSPRTDVLPALVSYGIEVFLALWPHLSGVGFEHSDFEGLSSTLKPSNSEVLCFVFFLLPALRESLLYSELPKGNPTGMVIKDHLSFITEVRGRTPVLLTLLVLDLTRAPACCHLGHGAPNSLSLPPQVML